jgi:hypothetical protein
LKTQKEQLERMMGRCSPIPEHLLEKEANKLMYKRASCIRGYHVVKENIASGVDPATTWLPSGRPIQPTDGLTEVQIHRRTACREATRKQRRKRKGQESIFVDDTKVPEMLKKQDKIFCQHIANIKGYMERHEDNFPIGWPHNVAPRKNMSPNESAQLSYIRVYNNMRAKKTSILAWKLTFLNEVGITRDNDGIFQKAK